MLTIDNAILVVVDVQGKLAEIMYDHDRLFDNLRKLILGAHVLLIPTVVTEQIPEKLGATSPELVRLFPDFQPIRKITFSCAGNEEFNAALRASGRSQVLLTGIETHVCVYQTALDLLTSGYEVHLVTDAVSSRAADNRALGIERIKEAGATLTSTEMALFELLKVAAGTQFKQIIQIVK
jgi:nicotinamidase-related amidase